MGSFLCDTMSSMNKRWIGRAFIVIGAGYGLLSLADYARSGYSWHMMFFWLGSLACIGITLALKRRRYVSGFEHTDLAIVAVLIMLFAPLYLWRLHQLPVQVNTDEITIMLFFQKLAASPNADPFGVMTGYFGFPAGIFILFGKIANLLGGVTLENVRLIHALSGLTIIASAYGLLRQLLRRWWAVAATIVIGVNHSLFMISRMAMRDNTGLLIELLALGLLVHGLKHRDRFWTFLGGAVAGLSMYTYYPARVILPIWLVTLAVYAVTQHLHVRRHLIIRLGAVTALAWLLVATPGLIAGQKQSAITGPYQRQQTLLTPEGRAHEQEWVPGSTVAQAVRTNIIQGLSTFNNKLVDQGYIYPNYGHGFVDPLTGWLVWLGLAVAAIQIIRRKRVEIGTILASVGFVSLWLSFSFLINKAPDYTRLLIVLPFVAYLVVYGFIGINRLLPRRLRIVLSGVAVLLLLVIVISNLSIAHDFIALGQSEGNNVGSTLRYVENLPQTPSYRIIMATDPQYMYYGWGESWQWQTWLSYGNPGATTEIVPPYLLLSSLPPNHFSLLMDDALWQSNQAELIARYPTAHVIEIAKSPRLIAFELP